jgi:hypothetical protein
VNRSLRKQGFVTASVESRCAIVLQRRLPRSADPPIHAISHDHEQPTDSPPFDGRQSQPASLLPFLLFPRPSVAWKRGRVEASLGDHRTMLKRKWLLLRPSLTAVHLALLALCLPSAVRAWRFKRLRITRPASPARLPAAPPPRPPEARLPTPAPTDPYAPHHRLRPHHAFHDSVASRYNFRLRQEFPFLPSNATTTPASSSAPRASPPPSTAATATRRPTTSGVSRRTPTASARPGT